jgi:hypothetical protein
MNEGAIRIALEYLQMIQPRYAATVLRILAAYAQKKAK